VTGESSALTGIGTPKVTGAPAVGRSTFSGTCWTRATTRPACALTSRASNGGVTIAPVAMRQTATQ
jgi:hypothetical protein